MKETYLGKVPNEFSFTEIVAPNHNEFFKNSAHLLYLLYLQLERWDCQFSDCGQGTAKLLEFSHKDKTMDY